MPENIGRYQILGFLGKGGFGAVYLGQDTELERKVAIKVPHDHRVGQDFEEWLKEARLVASLDHKHIVPVYDVGRTDDNQSFMVTKFIEGKTLRERLTEGGCTLAETCHLVEVIADALHEAHKHGIVHRDIKPANILIDSAGLPFLVDFGVALKEGQIEKLGTTAGTPTYMSPEQARGEGHRVDGRSDVFSLGIVLYQMLTGRKPFTGSDPMDVLHQVQFVEPKPLRQIDDSIPAEMERICLRAIEKRASLRYLTASDFADDLRHYLAHCDNSSTQITGGSIPLDRPSTSGLVSGSTHGQQTTHSTMQRPTVVPRGLRSFEENDADFFLQLLPGPYDRDGLPNSLRFWKERIEEPDPEKSFSVGLIYGPSGCGKSSLVKAGLIPVLDENICSVYIEASKDRTELRLLTALQNQYPLIPESASLTEALAGLRRGDYQTGAQTLLLVIDQFEQWLHIQRDLPQCELVNALRQCDGDYVRCILMVRDDFWMSATRLMAELETRIQEGWNSAAVDLFDKRHAAKVLQMFGVAYGKLPDRASDFRNSHRQFIKQAVDTLANEDRIVSVRLTVFAEMMKHREWTPDSLSTLGGTLGLGVTFLEDTFHRKTAPPEIRFHAKAARSVLKALLPEVGSDIKGRRQTEDDLKLACGYQNRASDFEALIQLLDGNLRLISPVDRLDEKAEQRSYRLAHDFLVGSLQDWLSRKQRETLKGRAELLLADRTAMWSAREERKQLPSFVEWARIRMLTRRSQHSVRESEMMRVTNRLHLKHLTAALLTAVTLVAGILWISHSVNQQRNIDLELAKVETLQNASVLEVSGLLDDLHQPAQQTIHRLNSLAEDATESHAARLYARLALLEHDPSVVDRILKDLPHATPAQILVIAETTRKSNTDIRDLTLAAYQKTDNKEQRLRQLGLLAQVSAAEINWSEFVPQITDHITALPALRCVEWGTVFAPIGDPFAKTLVDRCEHANDQIRSNAATLVAEHFHTNPEVIADVIATADADQFRTILPSLIQLTESIHPILQSRAQSSSPILRSRFPRPDDELRNSFDQSGQGQLLPNGAWCNRYPLNDLSVMIDRFRAAGYRLNCIRPVVQDQQIVVAATWLRDSTDWDFKLGMTADDLRSQHSQRRDAGMHPVDVCHYIAADESGEQTDQFAAIWMKRPSEYANNLMYADLDQAGYDSLKNYLANSESQLRLKSVQPSQNAAGETIYSCICWETKFDVSSHVQSSSSAAEFATTLARDPLLTQTDLRHVTAIENDDSSGAKTIFGTFWDGGGYESRTILEVDPQEHRQQAADLAANGFHPVAISSKLDAISSVWHRKHDERAIDRQAIQQVNAALALAHLGSMSQAAFFLKDTPDPRIRSFLIDRMASFQVPVKSVFSSLQTATSADVRQGLLLALAEYNDATISAAFRQQVINLAQSSFQNDPDAGVHSACDLLLRRLNAERPALTHKGIGNWQITSAGQMLSAVRGPVRFQMGSRPQTEGRTAAVENRRTKTIPRSFALSTQEITVKQFESFLPELKKIHTGFRYSIEISPDPQSAMNNLTWLDAAAYCRWLSDKEKLPEEEMCYPPLAEFNFKPDAETPYLSLPDNYLQRTGYRLPTEAEWEYMCRAGSITDRYFGQTQTLIDQHAWTNRNSTRNGRLGMQQVGLLRPNRQGMFDMLGNALEWCQCSHDASRADRFQTTDREDPLDVSDGVLNRNGSRQLRGGGFAYEAYYSAAGFRNIYGLPYTSALLPYRGFRIARTLRD